MNLVHRAYCRSARWRRSVEEKLLPWALEGVDLGDDVLEVGPGPGLVTDVLRKRVDQLTSVEIDPRLASRLAGRLRDSNVTVVHGDATALSLPDERFSAAVAFTMLHHVPSSALQDRLLSEVYRVLRPGGVFIGSDSRTSRMFELVHLFDTLVPIDPTTFGARLARIGFSDVSVDANERSPRFRFRAVRL